MRLAVFSPLPPVRSGIADYTVEWLHMLGNRHAADVFVGSRDEVAAGVDAPVATVRSAHDFVWARQRTPYDLVVYQMGNAWCHDYMWPYLFRWPGLVVLHDAQLHHARAWSLLRRRREADYRAELAFNHPALPPEAAEIGLSGFAGPLYYFWPMLRTVAASARALAVHNPRLAADLSEEFPATPVHTIPMGVAEPATSDDAIRAVRARHGCTSDAVVLAAFGAVTPEKRIEPILQALAVARLYHPRLRLLLVGQSMPHFDALAMARALGVGDLVEPAGYVPDREVPAYLGAADIVLSLRWPTARETSASWLRAMAAGRATVVTDLAQQADLPLLDPRTWRVAHARPTVELQAPLAVGIDILDEAHSLTLALRRLVHDAPLRTRIGRAARAWWAGAHTVAHMADGYEAALGDAAAGPDPAPVLPTHLRPDGAGHARALVGGFPGVSARALA